ncbi:MAG TPA: histidinol-phosphate transaminase [Chloroflexota bacterium]
MVHPRPVPSIADLAPAVHGSWEGNIESILDFSANGNVIGPPPAARDAIGAAAIDRYPERTSASLRQVLSRRHGLDPEMIVVGNGSTELIWAVARAYLAPGSVSLVLGPTYGEYATACRAAGAEVRDLWMAGELVPLPDYISDLQPMVAWLCHPNNPTGTPFPVELLPELIEAAPETLFVVDEAYWTLTHGLASAAAYVTGGHVVVLRSLTKDLGLAGLRVGYALAGRQVSDAMQRALPPWNVSSVAQAAALVALADTDHLELARGAVATSRGHLERGLHALGLEPCPSEANFVLVWVGDAAAITAGLLAQGCVVRDCKSFGLPEFIRIGVRSLPDQERLLAALAEVLGRRALTPPSPAAAGEGAVFRASPTTVGEAGRRGVAPGTGEGR